jgi:hypothetical protein
MYWRYLRYVLRHKFFVMIECWKRGLYWRGIVHDLSKLRPSEFIAYADFFYGPAVKARRDKTGYYSPNNTGDGDFDYAWLLHQKRNDHHWQWWILPTDDGTEQVFPMSLAARAEMWCDWRGAGRAQGKPDTAAWYEAAKGKMRLHPETRAWVAAQLVKLQS